MLLIKNGYVVDPKTGRNGLYDVLVEDGRIAKVDTCICDTDYDDIETFDAKGMYIMPGFVDLHEHFREPGYTYKETVKTGALAAARGGYTSVFCMPNTNPVIDSTETYNMLMDIIDRDACIHVYPVGAVTCGQKGTELADIKAMAELGMKAISEDGKSVMDSGLYARALDIAKECGITVFAHCEDINLVRGGVMNAGKYAEELGLPGITNAVEDITAARDIFLAKETGVKLHLCHVSTKDSVRMLELLKDSEHKITGEVCPHHFTLSDADIPCDDANYKMNPPLRSKEDVEALISGIKSGAISVIATDHAPHSEEEKSGSMKNSPFGIVGSETAFALSYTELVDKGIISLYELVKCMSTNPAEVADIDAGGLDEGDVADLVIADIDTWYHIDKSKFLSMGKNTPFDGRKVKGKIIRTYVSGELVYREEN
ncbi:MAG: dihydroorotase [Lachnospiraceae bacterium]|nr:dihydroorotase [Lachnospiraceae bacterium]